jgi:glycosyltransferase involved in cell wall biosynthesis
LEPLASIHDFPGFVRLAANHALEAVAARAAVDTTIMVSTDIGAKRAAVSRRTRIRIIHNGLDTTDLDGYTPAPAPGGAVQIGIVGRLVKVKGHDTLFSAMRHLTHLPHVHLHVFGTGPLRQTYEMLCRQYALGERVTFHGFCDDMPARMRSLDILAIPSLHEGLPYTLLEAMYLRIPIVATRVGGLQQVLEDGRTGLLVPPGNPRALAESLERLCLNPTLRAQLAEAGHQTVQRQYLVNRMTCAYLDVYREVVSR